MALLRRESSDTPIAVLEREHNDLLARRSALEQKLAQANDALREALAARLPAMAADFVLRVRQLISELPLALDELVREVQNLATRRASGQEPLCRPTPPVPEPPPAPVIDRMRVYALAPIRLREKDQTLCAPRYGWALPPRQLAERAIAAGLVDLPGTARVEQMVAGFGVDNGPADPACCTDLDALGREQEEAPTSMLPAGAVERIGPSRQILIDVERG